MHHFLQTIEYPEYKPCTDTAAQKSGQFLPLPPAGATCVGVGGPDERPTSDAGCYRDVDDQELLQWLSKEARTSEKYATLLNLIVGRHPGEELYDIQKDPDCLHNLATSPDHATARTKLAAQMDGELKRTRDPRLYGANPDIADTYVNVNPKNRMGEGNYPPPEKPTPLRHRR